MDKIAFKKKIGFLSLLLIISQFNVRPYSKNFILSPDTDEVIVDKISKISRSHIILEINDRWVEDSLISLLKSKPNLSYNIIISSDLSSIRIKNIKRLNPKKIGYIVNEFVNQKMIDSLTMLKPHNVYLIFKRLPENFEIDYVKNGKIREITIFLDNQSVQEFTNKIDVFQDLRLNIKPIQNEALPLLCTTLDGKDGVSITLDSRIIDVTNISQQLLQNCKIRFIYEIAANTYFNNFLNFIKTNITELNIYYNKEIPKRDNIIEWIIRTDP